MSGVERPMVAETLRTAATVLRERAAKATEGPWELDPNLWGLVRTYWDPEDVTYSSVTRDVTTDDGQWIATVHPGLAEPLAAWLEFEAGIADGNHEVYEDAHPAPLAVARVILEQAPGAPS